ncbi:signal transduction histidine kinase/CheY-like chemotaxis protein [Pedobacter cryoconitis]|uniref:histidine kinase n=1 Tax=Pedobacter cryoconitis TaxID=188932 RepID=A0A7W9E108_9SPHI|nr:hybrid sensor histidine kinase/response regulator [Pedobacter cryoconitis]MBB5637165.1 signal transduction histidine kinase/CheY-like chemotaxis protein [Pedobacter cryoconitis]
MKPTYTKFLSRKIILAFVAGVIILAIAALFVRYSITHKLENLSKFTRHIERDQSKPQRALLLLHQAEDDFQESLLSTDSTKNNAYKVKLSQAFDEIDSLLKEDTDTAGLSALQRDKVRYWYHEKIKLSENLYTLKHNFDSLLTAYTDLNQNQKNLPAISTVIHTRKKNAKTDTDTIRKDVVVKKKGLFTRLKDAISNTNASRAGIIEINHNRTSGSIDSVTMKIAGRDKRAYTKGIQQLQERNARLLTTQKELITLNIRINNEMERIINGVKEINYSIVAEFKEMAFKSYQETTALLNKFYLAALTLVLIFAVLLIIFIIKLDKSEVFLRQENDRAVTIAQQKMDLLLHMSHEIRNPLTAIKGFLYIFSRTNLSPRQKEMLGSITLSSDMLLLTLNDTLDAAKMESNEFKINAEPFNADYALKEVIESMEFSAAKKKLAIGYNFEGNKEAVLSGDSFRLKQIMVNLLSNAIKYTNTGGITVNAKLINVKQETRLEIGITDTGMGISTEQQANLFSKYYQTNSAKGKTGTGLGLYICKQMVELQKGEISVESKAGEGSTFKFYIPYQDGSTVENTPDKTGTDAQLLLLSGISILAVDDNELNLMFLKMMTSKWNVRFHQASNGIEALAILRKTPVNIVLTDIQMPEMDGYELLSAIRNSDSPINKIPVIVISGNEAEIEDANIKAKGFSGLITKPFIDADLVREISAVMPSESENS